MQLPKRWNFRAEATTFLQEVYPPIRTAAIYLLDYRDFPYSRYDRSSLVWTFEDPLEMREPLTRVAKWKGPGFTAAFNTQLILSKCSPGTATFRPVISAIALHALCVALSGTSHEDSETFEERVATSDFERRVARLYFRSRLKDRLLSLALTGQFSTKAEADSLAKRMHERWDADVSSAEGKYEPSPWLPKSAFRTTGRWSER